MKMSCDNHYHYNFNLVDPIKIECYEPLSKYTEYISLKREMRLNNLFGDNKFKYELSDINIFGSVGLRNINKINGTPVNTSFIIKSITFIIKYYYVLDLTITWRSLTTYQGRVIKNLINSGMPINISQSFVDGKFVGFYIDDKNL